MALGVRGDGAESEQESPEHQYTQKGEFEITLIVTDNGGLTGSATKTIQVGECEADRGIQFHPPIASKSWRSCEVYQRIY